LNIPSISFPPSLAAVKAAAVHLLVSPHIPALALHWPSTGPAPSPVRHLLGAETLQLAESTVHSLAAAAAPMAVAAPFGPMTACHGSPCLQTKFDLAALAALIIVAASRSAPFYILVLDPPFVLAHPPPPPSLVCSSLLPHRRLPRLQLPCEFLALLVDSTSSLLDLALPTGRFNAHSLTYLP
jgi:hypothetical protein